MDLPKKVHVRRDLFKRGVRAETILAWTNRRMTTLSNMSGKVYDLLCISQQRIPNDGEMNLQSETCTLTRRDLVWKFGRLIRGAGALSLLPTSLLAQKSPSVESRRPLPQDRKFRSNAVESYTASICRSICRPGVGRSLYRLLPKYPRYNRSTGYV